MKKIILAAVILIASGITKAQNVAINNSGSAADASAMLDVSSSSKGILIPRLNTAQRTTMGSPANGLLVFDNTTNSFWFFSTTWKELNAGGNTAGPASGDLYGTYPAPNVGKIQNLDVAPGVPFDKQIMKWDALNNKWQGLNDSLFLPYNVTFGSPTKLFGITNANTTNGSSAIYGKSGNAGSGITPPVTMGVWGDNATGNGVVGTSINGVGTYGLSFQNHGVSGYSTSNAYAGVFGSHAGTGVGVMGEAGNGGTGILGQSTNAVGKAAVFINTNISNADTVVKVMQMGTGMGAYMKSTANSTKPALQIDNNGNSNAIKVNAAGSSAMAYLNNTNISSTEASVYLESDNLGDGLKAILTNTGNTNAGLHVTNMGIGTAITAGSDLGIGAKIFNTNADNLNQSLWVSTNSLGTAAVFQKNNTGGNISDDLKPAVLIDNSSKGNGLKIVSLHAPSLKSGIDVQYDGQAFGINVSSAKGGIYSSSNSATATSIQGVNNVGGMAIKGFANSSTYAGVIGENNHASGIGVQGTTTAVNGMGVLGTSTTDANTDFLGSVTGINSSTGIAVYGGALTGTGVKGFSGSSSADGVYGRNTGGGDGVSGESLGADASGVRGLAQPTNGTFGVGVTGQSFNYGDGVRGFGGLSGNGVSGFAEANTAGIGIYGEKNGGTGYAIKGSSNLSNQAAILGLNSNGDGIAGTSNGAGNGVSGTAGTTGAGVYGTSGPISSTGRAALFDIPAATNAYDAVQIFNHGLGANLYLKNFSASNNATMMTMTKAGSGDFMILEDGAGANKIRFDNNGKGFFNGGTQAGGADMAEAFDVADDIKNYEPGDVLIISVDKDRSVIRSNGAYSNLVAGVYATKPGMLMTEEDMDADLSDKVPMGVMGVIPTKVCMEAGEIKRGDFIVTSSIIGVAMKADIDKVKPGQIIGKALENYSAGGIGKIRVLVNVK